MKTWQDKLIEQFIPELEPRVWAVEDPDGMIRNERVMAALSEKGFDIVFFDDPVAFRYEYESSVRRAWERGEHHPIVILYEPGSVLPSDLLQRAHRKNFALHAVFPGLDADVMRTLPVEWWEQIRKKAPRSSSKSYTASETEDLALKVCCKLVPDLIDSDAAWISKVIEIHRLALPIPDRLCQRVQRDFHNMGLFQEWPIYEMLRDPQLLWAFLQERWLLFLFDKGVLGDAQPPCKIPGPQRIPFDSAALQVYWNNLFEEGFLNVVDCGDQAIPPDAWWRIGVVGAASASHFDIVRLEHLLADIPQDGATYKDWIQFGLKYSRIVADLFCEDHKEAIQRFWDQVWPAVDERFHLWVQEGYTGLHNLAPCPPKMVHHIPKQLLRWYLDGEKIALIVLDGLSCAGWVALRNKVLPPTHAGLDVQESALFAWLPSLTSVSRQALFSGLTPKLFTDTFSRTDKDANRWSEFWESSASSLPKRIVHQLLAGMPEDLALLPDFKVNQVNIYGATVCMPDTLMHGLKLGWRALNEQLAVWAENGFLRQYLEHLLDAGFRVCLTSDHGNLESIGSGRINEGVLAEKRGQRIRIYPDGSLRDQSLAAAEKTGFTWDTLLLPASQFPVYARGRTSFVSKGDVIVAHGGASLDELLVPWISIRRNC